MNTLILTETIMKQVEALPEEQQFQVLSYIQSLKTAPPEGVPGRSLLRFAGIIPAEDVDAMEKAIEEDCERIDIHEW